MASSNEKVRELVELLGIREEAESAFGAMVADGLKDGSLVGIGVGKINEVRLKAADKYIERAVMIYEEHYTEEQVDELLKFFRSAVGTMFVAKQREMDRVLGDISLQEGESFQRALTL